MGEPMGPIEKGMTYRVRPFIQPWYSPRMVFLSSSGWTQLLVGPASSCECVLMYVRSSTRATSLGSVRNRKLFARFLSGIAMPRSLRSAIIRSYSSFDPLHQTILSGLQRSAVSLTHAFSFSFLDPLFIATLLEYHFPVSGPRPHRDRVG